MRALSIASTGMLAQQTNVEVIANNLANMNTTAFKQQRAEFTDLLYQNMVMPGSASTQQTTNAAGLQVGLGTKPGASEVLQLQGNIGIHAITHQPALGRLVVVDRLKREVADFR